jgi:hypothetical protein
MTLEMTVVFAVGFFVVCLAAMVVGDLALNRKVVLS